VLPHFYELKPNPVRFFKTKNGGAIFSFDIKPKNLWRMLRVRHRFSLFWQNQNFYRTTSLTML
jgi:hypothetical protein